MELLNGYLGLLLAVLSICALLYKFVQYIVENIVSPMGRHIDAIGENITALESMTKEMRTICDRFREDIHDLDKRITLVEQKSEAAHKRIDAMERKRERHED